MHDDMREIRISSISVKENLRREPLDVGDLVESIRDRGLLQPVLVRRCGDGYELVAGHRRLEACKQLGMERIPAVLHDAAESDRLLLQFAENIQRKDVSPYDLACALRQLLPRFKSTVPLAMAIRKGRHWVRDHLTYADIYDELERAGVETERLAALPIQTMLELAAVEPRDRLALIEQITAVGDNGKIVAVSQLRARRLIDAQIARRREEQAANSVGSQKRRQVVGLRFSFSVMAKTIVVACEDTAMRDRVVQRLLELGGRRT